MEIKKFEKMFYENEETTVFVKDGDNKIEILLSTNNDRSYWGKVYKNWEKVADTWKEAVHLYHSFGCANIEAEMSFSYEAHLDDEDEGEAAEEAFDAAVTAAKNWLYPEEAGQ